MLQRRDFILGLTMAGPALPLQARPSEPALRQAADDVYWVDAANAEANAGNRGRVAHTGVIVAPKGLIVVDPGPSFRSGTWLREMLQDRLHRRVAAVVNTHPHPENVLANGAFVGVPIHASGITRRLMARRCKTCLARLRETLGADEMAGTRIVLPTAELAPGAARQIAGIEFAVRTFAQAHSQGDLAMFHSPTGTVFGGGLAYNDRIPEMQEASAFGWLKAIDALAAWPVRHFIGSGVGSKADTLVATREYLMDLVQSVAREIRRGGDIGNLAVPPQARWAKWQELPRRHPLNVQHVWHELEDLWWRGQLPATLG